MAFSEKEIRHLANLSALNFKDEEIEAFRSEFENITKFVSQIQATSIPAEIVYDKVIPLSELREDKPQKSFTNEEVLLNAPAKAKGAFAVPLMME